MPNWCDNYICISGPKKIIEKISETQLSLSKLFPCPEELNDVISGSIGNKKKENDFFKSQLKNNLKKYGSEDWYHWNVKNWGTKWDINTDNFDVEYQGNKGTISMSFQSAWGPPLTAFKNLAAKYPDLSVKLDYVETGAAFAGTYTYSPDDGEEDEYIDYKDSNELLSFAREFGNDLAKDEAQYIAEREAEDEEYANKNKEED